MGVSRSTVCNTFQLTALSMVLGSANVVAQGVHSTSLTAEAVQTPAATQLKAITVIGDPETTQLPWVTKTTKQMLDALLVNNLNEFGSRVEPGVNFNNTAKSINIRGLQGTRVVTRIDGVRQSYLEDVRSIRGGIRGGSDAFDFGALHAVDVIRGNDSAAVGSGALGGVLNVHSLRPDDVINPANDFGVMVRTGYQSRDNSWMLNGAVAAKTTFGLRWLFQAGVKQGHEIKNQATIGGYGAKRNQTNPKSYTQQNYLVKLEQHFEDGHVIDLSANYFDRRDDLSNLGQDVLMFAPGQSYVNEDLKRQSLALGYTWHKTTQDAWLDTFKAKAYWQSVDLWSASTALRTRMPKGDYYRRNSIQETTLGLDMAMTKTIQGPVTQRWEFGGEFYGSTLKQHLKGRDSCPAKFAPDSICAYFNSNQSDMPKTEGKHLGVWLQNEIGFFDDSLMLTPAIRFDEYRYTPSIGGSYLADNPSAISLPSRSAQAWSPKVNLSWTPIQNLTLYAQYATGFNAPTVTQLYSRYGSPTLYLFTGNPNLKAERSHGWEFGVKTGDEHAQGALTWFDTSYSQFIDQVALPKVALYPMGVTSFDNLSDVRIYGLEAKAHWAFSRGWRLDGSMAWTVGKDRATNRYLNSVAPLRLIVGLSYDSEQWGVRGQFTATMARTKVAYPEATLTHKYPDFKAPGYGLVDVTAYWKPSAIKGLTVQAGLFNVFDKTYWNALDVPRAGSAPIARGVDYYTQPGRNFAVNLTYKY
ncbi:TonB-dependent hemoglobin/transferrin/lactoferrin family receptor [Orrella sp. 11846]|uniref:TonB-dependent hemoglobin/transferrin/lactoferrin family receptor n=1 Tax=Orrella sp. 11846 TaxID=3409913 RepID=UPI003B5BD944